MPWFIASNLAVVVVMGAASFLRAAEDLGAPPVTTSKAWILADEGTGAVLAEHEADEKLKSASTTKIMCAHLVLKITAGDPAAMSELIAISKLADATEGSTAGVKAGEKLTVRDALFGLMLPSGNDLGNALAEHFHPRLDPPGKETPSSVKTAGFRTRVNFIAEMNREAVRLGMTSTLYRLPYGDGGTDAERTTTARDLLTLSLAALKDPTLREIVNTPKHTGKILLPGATGRTREITWENTNQLLKLGGYDGVKTGMTNAAGYCLVATGSHAQSRLIIALLGAPTEAVRYAEVRNLFRWGWSRPGTTPAP